MSLECGGCVKFFVTLRALEVLGPLQEQQSALKHEHFSLFCL